MRSSRRGAGEDRRWLRFTPELAGPPRGSYARAHWLALVMVIDGHVSPFTLELLRADGWQLWGVLMSRDAAVWTRPGLGSWLLWAHHWFQTAKRAWYRRLVSHGALEQPHEACYYKDLRPAQDWSPEDTKPRGHVITWRPLGTDRAGARGARRP